MMPKLKRMFSYVREGFLMLFFVPAGAFCRHFSKKYRNLWLVAERGNDARDNGYRFYEYLRTMHPEVNAHYVITTDSADEMKIAALGGGVRYRGFSHYLMYYSAEYLIGTHVQPCAPDLIMYYHFASKGIKAHGRQIFLQHGITINGMEWLYRRSLRIDMFVCGGKPEYDFISTHFGHPDGVVRYLGFCRFDNLMRTAHRKKMILLMPTWRGARYPSGNEFEKTLYCSSFRSLIRSGRLSDMLEKYGYTLIFYPHVEMQKYVGCFTAGSERIIIATKETHDVQKLLTDCAALITDYSSVFFDVAYLGKPTLYYQFDEDDFRRYHYKEGYFSYRDNGFGPVCTTEDALLSELETLFESGMTVPSEYAKRIDGFFPLHDAKNCERTYDAIKNL